MAYFIGIFIGIFKIGIKTSDIKDIFFLLFALIIFHISVKGPVSCAKLLFFGCLTGIFIIVITLFTSHESGKAFLYVNDIPLTYSGLRTGIFSACRILSLLLLFSLFGIYIDGKRIVFLLGRFFPSTAIMINMIYRFSVRYKATLNTVKDIGRQFNITTESGNVFRRIRNGGHIYSSVVGIMLENSLDTAASMNSRGFYTAKRSVSHYHFYAKDMMLLIISLIFTCAVIFLKINGLILFIYITFPVFYNICRFIASKRRYPE